MRAGYFIAPTIVRDLYDDDAPLVREEQFGPVLAVLRYTDIDDVIARANVRGAKQSGLGGELGESGLNEYTQPHIINSVAL